MAEGRVVREGPHEVVKQPRRLMSVHEVVQQPRRLMSVPACAYSVFQWAVKQQQRTLILYGDL